MSKLSKKYGLKNERIVNAFGRVKELVRELENDERRVGQDFENSEIEFRLNPSEVAWYVAYKTAAETLRASSLSEIETVSSEK